MTFWCIPYMAMITHSNVHLVYKFLYDNGQLLEAIIKVNFFACFSVEGVQVMSAYKSRKATAKTLYLQVYLNKVRNNYCRNCSIILSIVLLASKYQYRHRS